MAERSILLRRLPPVRIRDCGSEQLAEQTTSLSDRAESDRHDPADGLPLPAGADRLSNRILRGVWVGSLIIPLLILVILTIQQEVPIEFLMRDPLAVSGSPYYYGLVSNLGIIVWCGSSAICLFCCLLVLRRSGWSEDVKFLLAAGVFTTLLMMDDLFMLHEVFYQYKFGIPEKVIMAIYGILAAFYILRFIKYWRTLAPLTFLTALALLSISVGTDIMFDADESVALRLTEDGCKFLGICQWGAFHLRVCWALTGGSTHA